jgi:hypothetical protein
MSVTSLTKIARAAALTLVLAGGGLAAMPAQAQVFMGGGDGPNGDHRDGRDGRDHRRGGTNFEFDIRIGGPGFRFHVDDHDRRRCDLMSIRQVRRDLRDRGYRDIEFVDRRGRIVQAEAERRGREFLITYDRCRGRIVDRHRI